MNSDTAGTALRQEREAARVTLNDLARATGWHRSTIWRYEGLASVPANVAVRYRGKLAELRGDLEDIAS